MFVRFGKILVVFALVTTLGLHLALLQTVAWTTMLANNLRTHSLSESVTRTFDGQYPCPLCRAIAAAKKSEQKNEFTLQKQRLEFPPAKENFVLIAPTQFEGFPPVNSSAKSVLQKPPTPPPRGFFVQSKRLLLA